MTKFGQKLYVNGRTKLNNLKNGEEGSTAVEFMGIAAVVVLIIFIFTKFFGDGGAGSSGITSILGGLIDVVSGWFGF
ncbi:MAG TPA: hypothetical protein VIG73_09335 [Cerasibacillus sp.]|uniref:hypothetical protein n=1 Tax=Cerasibacillus sp. TaxID=2498711 RepID=UPI002F41FD07